MVEDTLAWGQRACQKQGADAAQLSTSRSLPGSACKRRPSPCPSLCASQGKPWPEPKAPGNLQQLRAPGALPKRWSSLRRRRSCRRRRCSLTHPHAPVLAGPAAAGLGCARQHYQCQVGLVGSAAPLQLLLQRQQVQRHGTPPRLWSRLPRCPSHPMPSTAWPCRAQC